MWNPRTMIALAAVTVLAAGCRDDAPAPTAPGATTVPRSAAAAVEGEGCPCWTARTLAIAFADEAFFFDHRESAGFRPGLSLQAADHESATMLEAWVEYDGSAVDGAARSCHLSTVGVEGLVETMAEEDDLSPAAYAACAESVLDTAVLVGLRENPDPEADG